MPLNGSLKSVVKLHNIILGYSNLTLHNSKIVKAKLNFEKIPLTFQLAYANL